MRLLSLRRLRLLRRGRLRNMQRTLDVLDPKMDLSTTPWMLPLLHQSLGLPSRYPEPGIISKLPRRPPVDPLLVSIDCEFLLSRNKNIIREIGISTLDTARLKDLSTSSSSISHFQNTIKTYNFTFIRSRGSRRRPARIFGFNHQAQVSKSDFRQVLYDFTAANSADGAPRGVILIGHGFSNDIACMLREQFPLPNVEVLDTEKIATHLFSRQTLRVLEREKEKGLKQALSLRRLVGKLGMPFRRRLFHNAGNDSHMTMRLLLQLGVESTMNTNELQTPDYESRISVLQAIANSPLKKDRVYDDILFDSKQLAGISDRRINYIQEIARREMNSLKDKSLTKATHAPAPSENESSSVSTTNSDVAESDTPTQMEPSTSLDLSTDPSRQPSLSQLESSDTRSFASLTECTETSRVTAESATLPLEAGPSEDYPSPQQISPTLMIVDAARKLPGSMMIQRLQQILGLPRTHIDCTVDPEMPQKLLMDPLLVSIDCEFYEPDPGKHTIREIGISILDTRYLKSHSLASSSISAFQNAISTYNFTFECTINKVKNPSKFLFTKSARVSKSELQDVLREFTEARNSITQGKTRDVIIVGHDFGCDLQVLARENFLVPNVELLDTMKIARELLAHGADRGSMAIDYTLRGLLQGFCIPHTARNLHNGGNDSHLTLRLLLMLAVKSITGAVHAPVQQPAASVLSAVARSPLKRHVKLEKARFSRNDIERLLSISFKPRINAKIRKMNKVANGKSSSPNTSSVTASVVPPTQSDSSIAVDSPSSLDAPSGIAHADSKPPDTDGLPASPYSKKSKTAKRNLRRRRTVIRMRRRAAKAAIARSLQQYEPDSMPPTKASPKHLNTLSPEAPPLASDQQESRDLPPLKATSNSHFRTGLGYPDEYIQPTSSQTESSVSP